MPSELRELVDEARKQLDRLDREISLGCWKNEESGSYVVGARVVQDSLVVIRKLLNEAAERSPSPEIRPTVHFDGTMKPAPAPTTEGGDFVPGHDGQPPTATPIVPVGSQPGEDSVECENCDGVGSFERCKEVDSTGRRCNLSAQRHTRHQSNNSAWSAAPPTGKEPG